MTPALRNTVLLIAVAVSLVGGSEWSYKDESHWPGVCHIGTHQSPIDLGSTPAQIVKFDKLAFNNYQTPANISLVNNGHTVELQMRQPKSCLLSGAGLLGGYYLAAMHFHWGSEHTIAGKRMPLEMHLVHYGKQYSGVTEASQQPQGLAVVGVLFKESVEDNPKLVPLLAAMDKVDNTLGFPYPMSIAPAQLLPGDVTMYYRYEGSLTTPGCNETVVWTVMSAPVPISKKQLTKFMTLRVEDHPIGANYRTIQNLNGRTISTPPPPGSGVYRIHPVTSLTLAVAMLALAL